MVIMKKIIKTFSLVFITFLFLTFNAKATETIEVDSCFTTVGSGYYRLVQNIYAINYIRSGNSCIDIAHHNVILDLNGFGVYNRNINETFPFLVGIRVRPQVENTTIMNGFVGDFVWNGEGAGIFLAGMDILPIKNVEIKDIRVTNSTYGVFMRYVENARIQVAVDNPTSRYGIVGNYISNSSIMAFSRSTTYAGIFRNISNSLVSGHFDTNVIVLKNQTTIWGNIINVITLGLIPATVSETVVQTQEKGIGLVIWNSTNTIYKDISAFGLVSGVYCGKYSSNNIFGRIDLPLSDKMKGGKFGGIYLTPECVQNTLCEIRGFYLDDCNQLIFAISCPDKNNTLHDTCMNVFEITDLPIKQTLPELFLTPLLTIPIENYPILNMMTTPFFLIIMGFVGVSIMITRQTKKPEFGLFSLVGFVIFLSFVVRIYWLGIIFGIIMGYMLYKSYGERK